MRNKPCIRDQKFVIYDFLTSAFSFKFIFSYGLTADKFPNKKIVAYYALSVFVNFKLYVRN